MWRNKHKTSVSVCGNTDNTNKMQVPIQILHMNGGQGDYSYHSNSWFQKKVILESRQMVEKSIDELCQTSLPECVTMVDVGCSSGPNTLLPLWEIIEKFDSTCTKLNKKPPAILYFLNDLPGNDFNTIFRSLVPDFCVELGRRKGDKFGDCFIGAMPGDFYGRLFPSNSLHFVHSSSCLHWMSQVPEGLVSENGEPLNKGNICIDKSSSAVVRKAYRDQFEKDFTKFLRSKSEEMVCGGQMVLVFVCRSDKMPYCKYGVEIFQLIGYSLKDMVAQGIIEESTFEKFNIPVYSPSVEEVKKLIERESSLSINEGTLQEFSLSWDANIEDGNDELTFDLQQRATFVANFMRAAMEPMLSAHFGDSIMDTLFRTYSRKAVGCLESGSAFVTNVAVCITKIN